MTGGIKVYATDELAKARKNLGLKQAEMAELLTMTTQKPISTSLYQKWEQGKKPIMPVTAMLVARHLKIPSKYLWRFENDNQNN